MRILFLGTPEFAVPSLEALADQLTGVVTHPDRPKGRYLKLTPPPVKLAAEKYNLPVYQPERVSSPEFTMEMKKMGLDLIVVVAFGEILSKEVLEIPRIGCINLHASLLPKYRGAAPVAWALMNGERVTGVTTFWISERMDSGDIIFQKEAEVNTSDTCGTLEERLAEVGSKLLLDSVNKGTGIRIPQDDSQATYAPKLKKEDGEINWNHLAIQIHNKIRAMNPWPGAYTFMEGKRVEIWTSSVGKEGKGEPGTVIFMNEQGIGVAAGEGALVIKELQVEGKKRILAADFIHGYRINEGAKFGD